MTMFAVKAMAYDRKTMKSIGRARVENIDTRTNSLFRGVSNPDEIKMRYERFWNKLNPHSSEVVYVLSVKKKK